MLTREDNEVLSGSIPPGAPRPELYRVRPAGPVLPQGADWLADTRALREAPR
jgi:hypothetical protein